MFGILASGRLVNTEVQQAGPNQFFLSLDHAESVNHIVVFLTGQVPFSDGFGGSIYFGWPAADTGVSWQLLGFISNDKPSAIFKIAKVKPQSEALNPFGQETMDTLSVAAATALVGISVEGLDQIAQQTPSVNTEPSTVDAFTEFSQKMLESFFNYASSFAVSPVQNVLNPSEAYIPSKVLQQWYVTFQRRLQTNPQFWKTL